MDKTIDLLYIVQSLGLTILFVGLIGFERERKHKIAGLTTHILVALGASAIAIVQEVMLQDAIEFALSHPTIVVQLERQRIIAQVVAGVGFLGTGAILKQNGSISGLTTAATLWISAIIGIIFGTGQTMLGITVSLLALIILTVVKRIFGVAHEGHFSE